MLPSMETKIVPVNGLELFVRIGGSGPPLLLLHGFFQTGSQWQSYIDDLSRDFQLIIPDLRGHGQSTNPSGKFTYALTAADVLALLDHLEIETCLGVGYSLGGIALLIMAIEQPQRISAMSVWSSSPVLKEQARKVMRALTMKKIETEMTSWLQWLSANHVRTEGQFDALLAQYHRIAETSGILNLSARELGSIEAKTLIIHGDRDAYFPVDIATGLHATIPDSSLMILPNTGHGSVFKRLGEYMVSSPVADSNAQGGFPKIVKNFLVDAQEQTSAGNV